MSYAVLNGLATLQFVESPDCAAKLVTVSRDRATAEAETRTGLLVDQAG